MYYLTQVYMHLQNTNFVSERLVSVADFLEEFYTLARII